MSRPLVNSFETDEFKKQFRQWTGRLRQFASVRELRSSVWFRQEGVRIERLLSQPYVENGLSSVWRLERECSP